jgi:hypothetical protein
MSELISGLAGALVELFFEATGRGLLGLFGWRQPHEIASFLAGMAFWIAVAMVAWIGFSG